MEKNIDRQAVEQERRDRLKREKPLAHAKIVQLKDKFLRGECTAIIDFSYDYICNLSCEHCCNSKFAKKERVLTIDDLRDLSRQADEMGLCQFNISGGEPLLFKELDDIIAALQPEKFHLSMSSNGHFLTKEKAEHLRKIGLDKIRISIDSIDELLHDKNRCSKGAYQKAIDSIFIAKEAGLDVMIQHVATRENAQTQSAIDLAEFAQKHDLIADYAIVKAIGSYEGRLDVLINEDDANFIKELNEKYPSVRRDVFPAYGMDKGCGSVNCSLHLTKYGDILPCAYIHISIGNIFEEPLKDIVERGMKIKHFKNYNPKCLSGEDRCFISNYMSKFYGKPLPISWKEAFTEEDFCNEK